jgi:hypothetical protein
VHKRAFKQQLSVCGALSDFSSLLGGRAALVEQVIHGPCTLVGDAGSCILGCPAGNVVAASGANPGTAHAAGCACALWAGLRASSRGLPESLAALGGLVVNVVGARLGLATWGVVVVVVLQAGRQVRGGGQLCEALD